MRRGYGASRPFRLLLAALAVVLAAGCGGGSSDTSADPPPGGSGQVVDPGIEDIRAPFLSAVNQARAVGRYCGGTYHVPAPPVAWHDNLALAAYRHSLDMATNGFFSHTGSDGRTAGERLLDGGYDWATYGENIAAGYPTVESVVQGWLGSPGHCANIMNPAFTEIGAGYATGPFGGNPSARYWTFDLGDR